MDRADFVYRAAPLATLLVLGPLPVEPLRLAWPAVVHHTVVPFASVQRPACLIDAFSIPAVSEFGE